MGWQHRGNGVSLGGSLPYARRSRSRSDWGRDKERNDEILRDHDKTDSVVVHFLGRFVLTVSYKE